MEISVAASTLGQRSSLTKYSWPKPSIIGQNLILGQPFLSVTPSLDGDVLARLDHATEWLTVAQLHALLPERSDEGIRNTLTRLTRHRLVREKPIGRSRLFSLNRDHLLASAVVDIASAKKQFLGRLAQNCLSWGTPPLFGALFGSAARGEMVLESDIDIFFTQPANTDEDSFSEQVSLLCVEASRWTGNDVRPLVMAEELVVGGGDTEPVLIDIDTEGIFFAGEKQVFSSLIGSQWGR